MAHVVHDRMRMYWSSWITPMLSFYYLRRILLRPRHQKEFQPFNNPHYSPEHRAMEGDFWMRYLAGWMERGKHPRIPVWVFYSAWQGFLNKLQWALKKKRYQEYLSLACIWHPCEMALELLMVFYAQEEMLCPVFPSAWMKKKVPVLKLFMMP